MNYFVGFIPTEIFTGFLITECSMTEWQKREKSVPIFWPLEGSKKRKELWTCAVKVNSNRTQKSNHSRVKPAAS